MFKLKPIFLFLIVYLLSKPFFAQQLMLPLGSGYADKIAFELNRQSKPVNTGFKPLLQSEIAACFDIDSLIYDTEGAKRFFSKHKKNFFYRKLLFEDFIFIEKKNFVLQINPLFFVEGGRVFPKNDTNYFINTRGIELKGQIGKKLSFYSSFRENQARFRSYIHARVWERLVVPGQGAVKKNGKDASLFDFSSAAAYLSFTPYNFLNIQLGQDKNFIGEGHRSLFLSDNSMNYPFLKFNVSFKNFKYTSMFTQFRDFEKVYYSYHFRKHAAFNYLSYNYKNRFEIALFEGALYQTTDTAKYTNRFPADFFIPVPGVRTAVNSLQKTQHHILMGLNAKLKVSQHIQAYGQIALDNPQDKKFAFQAGVKIFDLFFSKIPEFRWHLQAEHNFAQAKTYAHQSLKYQTWTHYNEELSSYFGNNFAEWFASTNIAFKRLSLSFSCNWVQLNRQGISSDIYASGSTANTPEQKVSHQMLHFSYIINPRTHLQLYAGADRRIAAGLKETYFMFGIRTGISNFYYDF